MKTRYLILISSLLLTGCTFQVDGDTVDEWVEQSKEAARNVGRQVKEGAQNAKEWAESRDEGNADEAATPSAGSETDSRQYSDRAARITKGCSSEYEKANAIYRWLCANIAYDVDYKISDGEECWRQRKGVCNAYSELFVSLAAECGVTAHKVVGWCKNANYPNGDGYHAWVAVKADGRWMLVDATWGAGAVDGKKFTRSKDDMSWFDVDPHWMIFTHYPQEEQYQLLSNPLSEAQFKQLPICRPSLGTMGWNAKACLEYFMQHPHANMPQMYDNEDAKKHLTLVDVPIQRCLKAGHSYTFKVRSSGTKLQPAIYLPGESLKSAPKTTWDKNGDVYAATVTPKKAGTLRLCYFKNGAFVMSWSEIMEYQVE